uniref:Uncharacterized protein n=1 Tax=Anguilla anguilla TaxID=7936 RepID=A0A0E9VKV4_ANGAN
MHISFGFPCGTSEPALFYCERASKGKSLIFLELVPFLSISKDPLC